MMPVWGIWNGARGAVGHCTGRSHRIGARVHPGPAQLPTNRGSTDAQRGETKERGPRERRKADLLLHVLTILLSRGPCPFFLSLPTTKPLCSAFKMYPDDGSFLPRLGSRPPSSLTWMMAAISSRASLLGLPDFVSHPS